MKEYDGLIQGMGFIKERKIIILFDSRATHSFIYLDCVKNLALYVSNLPFDLSVATSTKEKLVTSIACFNCPLVYQGVSYLIDLICLPIFGLDVILGMNWLSSNHVVINCFDKTISITK